jgi:acyl-CoA synthetase (AMP-forming)/AMP-acid ligase II
MKTIQDVIRKWADVSPERTSLLSSQGSALSYRELAQAFDWLGATLSEHELGNSPRLATVLPSGIMEAVTFLGVSCRAAAAPLNPRYGEREFEVFLTDLSPQALLLEDGFETPARGVARARDIPSPAGDTPTRPEFLPSPEDTALLLSTSGTTSRPKRVPLTHANLIASAENVARSIQLSPQDRCLNPMPLFHIHGLVAGLLAPLFSGGSTIVASGLPAEGLLRWIDSGKPTWYTAVPTIHQAILAEARNRSCAARHHLRFIRSCSASLSPSLQADMETVFEIPVVEAYGMPEASHQIAINPLPPHPRKPGSVGCPTGVQVCIIPPEQANTTGISRGEIAIRGKSVTRGYAANSAANQDAFVDGWFRTGDEPRRREDRPSGD